jgi:hypothetical protein
MPSSGVLLESTMRNQRVGGTALGSGVLGTVVSRSVDGGATWTEDVAGNRQVLNDRPFLLVDDERHLLLSFLGIPGGIEVMRSADAGASFGLPIPVTGPLPATALNGGPALDPGRRAIVIPYADSSDPACVSVVAGCVDRIHVARSRDRGATWAAAETVRALPPGTGVTAVPAAAADLRGREYVVVGTAAGAPGPPQPSTCCAHVWLTHQDPAGGWSAPAQVDTPGGSAMLPWVAVRPDGSVVVAYYASSFPDAQAQVRPWRVEVALSTDGGGTFTRTQVSGPAPAYLGTGADHQRTVWDLLGLTTDRTGAIHVAWTDAGGRQGAPTRILYARGTG